MHLIRAIAFATAAAAAAPVPEDKDPRAQNKDLRAENEDLRERLAAAEAAVAAFRASSSFEDSVSKEVGQHRRLNSVCDCVRDCGVVSPKPTPEPADEPTPADKPETGVTLGSGAPELSRGPQLSSQGNEMLGILCALRDAPVDNSKPHLSGLFSQINQKTQLAFDAATKGKRLDFSSRPVHNSPRSHAADDYGRGCGGGKNNATMGCFFAPVDDAACAASRAPRSAAGAFRALAANWTRHEALAAFTEVLWRPSAAVRATTAAMRKALDLPAETRVALGVQARRGDRLRWEAGHADAGFTMFDDAAWVDFFAQHTASGDVAVVLTQDDALAAKLARASAARGVRVVHVDAALRSADLPFGQFLVAAVALLAEADVVAANSGSNMGRAAFVAAKRDARGAPPMLDFDGHWTAEDAAHGYAPCLLQYMVRSAGPKLDGCPGDAPAARASTREDRDYDERSAMHYAFQEVAKKKSSKRLHTIRFATWVSEFIRAEFNATVPGRYIREFYRQDMIECLVMTKTSWKLSWADKQYMTFIRRDPGYKKAYEKRQSKPSHFNAVSTEYRTAGLGANLCSRVC